MGILIDYPIWFLLLCILAGAGYTFTLYFRTRSSDIPIWLTRLMAVFRFLTVTVLCFLLLSPLIKCTTQIIEKPLILLAVDNSASIISGKDSAFYRTEYPEQLNKFISDLGKKNEVVTLSFGEKVRFPAQSGFHEKLTDISSLFDEVKSRYSNRNVGAMILASDGIYNKGSNPFYSAEDLNFPVYTIALGDTVRIKDILVKKVNSNPTAFLGDKFPMEVLIESQKCNGDKSEITINDKNGVLFKKQLNFTGEKDFQKVTLILDAVKKGIQHYTITLTPVSGEQNIKNNRSEIFVEVLETRQKVALLYQDPHPDLSALRQALESTRKYELDLKKVSEFTEQAGKYDLIILYQLPSLDGINNLNGIINSGISLLYILGTQTDLVSFNQLKSGLQVIGTKNNFTEAVPALNPDFTLFTTDNQLVNTLKEFPPLVAPFGTYQFSPATEVLFYQRIGNVTSRVPLALFFQGAGKKTGVICGENLWKWRFSDFMQKGNHEQFDLLFNKIIQYLAVKEDKSFFRVKCNNRFLENEQVEMDAELYNESYEMINQPDVNLTITDEQNKTYSFVFGKTEKAYWLNAGMLPVGKYTYSATAKLGKNFYQKSGEFIVAPLDMESLNTVADHNLLYRIARAHDGELVYPRNLAELEKKINLRSDVKPVIYTQKRFRDLAGSIPVFLLIIGLLTAEWFIRKRSGLY